MCAGAAAGSSTKGTSSNQGLAGVYGAVQ